MGTVGKEPRHESRGGHSAKQHEELQATNLQLSRASGIRVNAELDPEPQQGSITWLQDQHEQFRRVECRAKYLLSRVKGLTLDVTTEKHRCVCVF